MLDNIWPIFFSVLLAQHVWMSYMDNAKLKLVLKLKQKQPKINTYHKPSSFEAFIKHIVGTKSPYFHQPQPHSLIHL